MQETKIAGSAQKIGTSACKKRPERKLNGLFVAFMQERALQSVLALLHTHRFDRDPTGRFICTALVLELALVCALVIRSGAKRCKLSVIRSAGYRTY